MREQLEPVRRALELPEESPPAPLSRLVLELAGLAPEARAPAVHTLATRLEQLAAGPDGGDARALIEGLEQGWFNELIDERGRPLRALAVEALLRLGYPWALQIVPGDLDWYRAQARSAAPSRRLLWATLAALLSGLAGAGWWALEARPRPAPPVEAPRATTPASSVEVYRIESGARLAQLTVEVPAGVPAQAEVSLGTISVLPAEGPALEVLRVNGAGLTTERRRGASERSLGLIVPLTPERFQPNRAYVFTAELLVGDRRSGQATSPAFQVTSPAFQVTEPPLRRRDARPLTPTERWTLSTPPPRLRGPARLLLGIDSDGRLLWSQFLRTGPEDRVELDDYLRRVRAQAKAMFRPRPSPTAGPSEGGIIDWDPAAPREP